ncbi:DNA -binding domain-containing protein [Pelagibacterium luteolum]|uniref:Uncharacterized conserved protein n=1 Tax=Pelagibacterium luteolum TaxID=440168 RepID=A0A1G7YJY2_9HYPH|nr:DUF2285 domain-containing protein [Pelagibacterium luteolum]SDG96636.1 Uncharacterized conserved protein [Pelagibacterium luteolum]
MAKPKPEREPEIADAPVFTDRLTDYDYRLMIVYLRLLDAEADGADWTEAARIVLRIDPDAEPERALHAHETHLARAHWMTRQGYRHLLRAARTH